MDTYHVVLYVHLLFLVLGFGAAGVIGIGLFRLRAAQTLADVIPFGTLAGQTERVFPVAIVGLFATGAYMTSDLGIAWNMTEKPGAAVAGASIVIAYAVGAAVAWPFTRTPAVSAAPVTVAG